VPEIVTFDAHGTLVDLQLNAPTAELLKDRTAEAGVDTQEFLDTLWINPRNQPGSPAYDYEELPDLSKQPELLGC
jgi:FMN phosphatase YigB (HAD superfamily)